MKYNSKMCIIIIIIINSVYVNDKYYINLVFI